MFKKIICVLSCISLTLLCLPVFSNAAVTVYSDLPEPVPTGNVKYFVVSINDAVSLYMISSPYQDIDVSASIVSNKLTITAISRALDASTDVYMTAYNVYNGSLRTNSFKMPVGAVHGYFVYTFGNFPTNSNTLLFSSYGVSLESGFNLQPCNIVWNESPDPSVYTSKLTQIYNKLNEIDQNTDNVEEILSTIESELELLNLLFLEYAEQNHTDLELIYLMISNIYSLLTEEQTTRAPAIPGEDKTQVEEIMSNEAALNKDYSSDLNNQFNVAGNIFEGNDAFSFISNLFSEMILSFPALNTLIIFSLALGLCVLILGRRLNA